MIPSSLLPLFEEVGSKSPYLKMGKGLVKRNVPDKARLTSVGRKRGSLGGVAMPFKEEPSVRHGALDAVEDLPGICSICALA